MFIRILLVIITFPIVILTPSPIGLIPNDIGKEIVSYGGDIFGGVIGIVGIYITLQYEKSKQIYENKRKALPLLEIFPVSELDYKYQYIQFDFLFTEESFSRNRKDIPDTASVLVSIKNVGYRELYDLFLGDFEARWFKEENMYYHMKSVLYQEHDLKLNFLFYERGQYDDDSLSGIYDTYICPLRFSCYYKDCYNNWYKQDLEISFVFNLEQNIDSDERALNISYERGKVLSAPQEIDEDTLPWKNCENICEC